MCRLSETCIESRKFIGWWRRCHPRCPHAISLYWRNAPFAPQIYLPSRSSHISPSVTLAFFWPDFDRFTLAFLHLHFGDCSSGTTFSLRWSAMEYRHCQPPFSCFITSDNPHSKCVKCMGFSHAREAVFGISKCTFCENLHLKTLRSRLEVFERKSTFSPPCSGGLCDLTWIHDLGLGCRVWGDGEWVDRPTQSLWTCFCAPPKSSPLIGQMSPASLSLQNSMSGSLAA